MRVAAELAGGGEQPEDEPGVEYLWRCEALRNAALAATPWGTYMYLSTIEFLLLSQPQYCGTTYTVVLSIGKYNVMYIVY